MTEAATSDLRAALDVYEVSRDLPDGSTRKKGQSLYVGDIRITLLEIEGNRVRLGFEVPLVPPELAAFARSQSILVAPFSGEDERRMSALGAGERAMQAASGVPPASAAQLEHQLYAAAALASAVPGATPPGSVAPARRFCRMCGVEAAAGARFCSACAAPLDA